MKRIFISFFLLVFCSVSSWAMDKPLIDIKLKETEAQINEEQQKCAEKETNLIKRYDCMDKISLQYEQQGEIRGTERYCEVNYIKYDFSRLKELHKKLHQQQKNARSSLDLMSGDRQKGEVTKQDLQTEIQWIEAVLSKMQRVQTSEKAKSLQFKTIN